MRQQFSKTMFQVGEQDSRLFMVLGDIGVFGLRDFSQKWPERFLNAGIREQAMVSLASGLAKTGFIPVVHSITPFVVERCFEQIKVDFGYQAMSGNIVSVGGGFDYAGLGCTHHSYSDIALLRSLPGTKVFVPGNALEFDILFKKNYSDGVNYFRLGGRSHQIEIPSEVIESGKAHVVAKGDRITVVTMGPLLNECLRAVEIANAKGACEIVYYSTIKPFDVATLAESVRKTGRVLVVEDHNIHGGLSDQVAASLTALGTAFTLTSRGVNDRFIHDYGNYDQMLKIVGIDASSLADDLQNLLERS